MSTAQLSGLRKAAILLVQLGKEHSAEILKQLREPEVEALTAEIARLENVDVDTLDGVLEEFQQLAKARKYYVQGGVSFAEEVLVATMGQDKANEVMQRLSASMVEMPFEFLRRVEPKVLLTYLADEHPQTIALVIAYLPADQAAIVLSGLLPETQAEVAHRLAIMDRTSPEIVKQVEAHLERRLSTVVQAADSTTVGGLKPLVDIINQSDRTTERMILDGLEKRDLDLAEEVRAHMFMFEDITGLDDRAIQVVLRKVESKDLAVALKGVREDVREKITRNMSERAALSLADEISILGPVRLKQVEEAQAVVIRQIRMLEEAGEIVVARGGGDEFVA
ncbi:flagellar motor switch protein FliG [Dermatophilus congolensis]|uniref:Flagellar motor switch protein FliG n=1 Tax=Dermatophilus congolensis TaxID=1863 RepID=A0A239VU29_9MICO|nr:flagellar motor switch protein FliG [Dermatophilus congolensis]MBO3129999.1 flagellar motor switch protein FliG [Dermatophilus congolensis]MBO3131371.1 flagellar motor switch protein FliG [Dermatophilus congolensis]MBO3134473.1 flagellar motor switch protein FliG [Dermatophilus congolensis]MBO3136708.1 flagellar motor switch protein FliG [Dermatophilus congolensis]MBO3138953.1 flagellar motor switch protein FliG [Dermatophilus congolensis]